MDKLAEKLRERMDLDGMSVRSAGQKIGVSHSTVARIVHGEAVDVDTLVKVCDFLNIPVESVLDVREEPEESLRDLNLVISTEPELSQVFHKIAQGIINDEIDKTILAEIAAFANYRLEQHTQEQNKQVKQAA